MDKVKQEILRLEPRIDLLHDLLGFGRYADVTVTSDGFFLGRRHGHMGFNDFLGHPSEAAVTRTRRLFENLSSESREKVALIFLSKGFPLEFLKPENLNIAVNRKNR